MNWLAEATYTGEALNFADLALLRQMKTDNKVVLVLTDGRSDTDRDKTPLNTLCGKDYLVSALYIQVAVYVCITPLLD